MAEEDSKFLKYQDKDGNLLIDSCPDIPFTPAPLECPACEPNPSYIAPNWKKQTIDEPWLNQKECRYYITVTTSESSLLPADNPNASDAEIETYLEELRQSHFVEAAEGLLIAYNKKSDAETIDMILPAMRNDKYALDSRKYARLKLLYSIAYEDFAGLDDDPGDTDDDEDTDTTVVVTYVADTLYHKLRTFQKTMQLFSRFYYGMRLMDKGSFIFHPEDGVETLFTNEQFDRYGTGMFGDDYMMSALKSLDEFLNNRGFNIFTGFEVKDWFSLKHKVEKVEFSFSKDFHLEKLKVVAECGEGEWTGNKLRGLNQREVYRDKTAMGYLSKLDEMDKSIKARETPPWLEFITTYTYPPVKETFDWPYQGEGDAATSNCIAGALEQEGKQLGMDILNDTMSISKAVAYAYVKNVCITGSAPPEEEAAEEDTGGPLAVVNYWKELGIIYDPDIDPEQNIFAYATEQAFKELETDSQPFLSVCAKMKLGNATGGDKRMLDELWSQAFDEAKLCGLNQFLSQGLTCLMGSVTFEEFLGTSILAGLKAMTLENFGQLFAGLPEDKQAEIQSTLNERLESGQLFEDNSGNDQLSELIASLNTDVPQPWTDEGLVALQNANTTENPATNAPVVPTTLSTTSLEPNRRTLAQQFDNAASTYSEVPGIMELWSAAIIEHYQDELLELVDELGKFPGAQVITTTLLAMDCPRPPLFTPTFMEKMATMRTDLPWCKTKSDVSTPEIKSPTKWRSQYKDWTGFIYEAAELIIQQIIVTTITQIIKKVCQLIGDAVCKAIETAGKLATAAVVDGASANFTDIIREAICGPEADPETVDATIQEMFEKLGVGGAALADPVAVQGFVADMSSAASRTELMNALDGDLSDELAEILDNLLEYEYPQFRDGLPNRGSIGDFLKNVGNIMPTDVRGAMKDFVNSLPANDMLPANPSLCATPEDLEEYCNLRVALLTGRATPAQSQDMCQADTDERLADLADLANALNGIPWNLPPLTSDPGCENGIFPFENPMVTAATAAALGGSMEQLKIDFVTDMIGNGPGWSDWGLLNMVLSDTMGHALSTHHRKVAWSRSKVDIVTDHSLPDDFESNFLWIFKDPVATDGQFSNFPYYVAEWLRDQLGALTIDFSSGNEVAPVEVFQQSFEDLGIDSYGSSVNILGVPDYGYNISLDTKWGDNPETTASVEYETYYNGATMQFEERPVNGGVENGWVQLERLPRKGVPDIQLSFRDNFEGESVWSEEKQGQFGVGYNIGLYLGDIEEQSPGSETYANKGTPTAPLDANRVLIYELLNENAMVNSPISTDDFKGPMIQIGEALAGEQAAGGAVTVDQIFEFLAIDDTLGYLYKEQRLADYPKFASCFETLQEYMPQVVLLDEYLDKANTAVGSPGKDALKSYIDDYMNTFLSDIKTKMVDNEAAWAYGAKFDELSPRDIEYVVDDDQVTDAYLLGEYYDTIPGGTLYSLIRIMDTTATAKFPGATGYRRLRNADAVMGMSRDQYNNKDTPEKIRAFYLNPATYGGTYPSPAIYIKPHKNEGWMGMAEVLFPELSPCKPSKKEMVDFDGIQDDINDNYNKIADDPRLATTNECTLQVPYNRILERPSVAGIEGVIRAACRIYATTHFLKASAMFSLFHPAHQRETFGSLYAQFIVEDMEASFKDAQNGFFEFFNPFKDDEFWYGFLEMAVQTYGRLLDENRIPPPTPAIQEVLNRLNDMQAGYEYPSRKDLQDAKDADTVSWFKTLDGYRETKNFEAVQATEEDAKMILKEFIMMELEEMGNVFMENLKNLDRVAEYSRLGYYVLTNKSQGGIDLDLHKKVEKEYTDLPESGEGFYTAGNEFSNSATAEMYTGYYHVEKDEGGTPIYISGEYKKSGEDQVVLRPWATKIILPIGDIQEYNSGASYDLDSIDTPFIIEKYISINGNKGNPSTAISQIQAKKTGNISDHYPGTMEVVTEIDETTGAEKEIGITGDLGVRHGIVFSMAIKGVKYEIISVEVDALDLKVTDVQPLEGNSELLYCLIKKLIEDDAYVLFTQYIHPMPKGLSTLAIYNDMGFLPSIGQVTVEEGLGKPGWRGDSDRTIETIPGTIATFPNADEGDYTADYSYSKEGWANYNDRQPGLFASIPGSPQWLFGLFIVTWDEWDKILLKNSKSRLKKMFKTYYYSKDFSPFTFKIDFGQVYLKNLKSSMFASPAIKLLPWWKRNRIRSNPFDANGNLCEKD